MTENIIGNHDSLFRHLSTLFYSVTCRLFFLLLLTLAGWTLELQDFNIFSKEGSAFASPAYAPDVRISRIVSDWISPGSWKYTERKKKRNSKFEIELQNNLCIYFQICFTTRKSKQSFITICLNNILSSNSRQKAGGLTALPHTKSDDNSPSKVYLFFKIS